MKLKKFVKLKPRVSRKFDSFNIKVKGKPGLKILVNQDSKLKTAVRGVFSKRGAATLAAGTAVGFGINELHNYIQSNSGCFLRKRDGEVCKVKSLSCCQPSSVRSLSFCESEPPELVDACNGFDEDKEGSCCRLCNCEHYGCLPGQKMECRRPTVAEALSHFAQGLTTSLLGWLWIPLLWLGCIAAAVILVLWLVRDKTRWQNK